MPDFLYMLFVSDSFVYVKMIIISDIFYLLCSVKILYSNLLFVF